MPSRADVEAATPKCPAGPDHHLKSLRVKKLCMRPMTWRHADGFWVCKKHGLIEPGNQMVARQRGLERVP